MIKELLPIIKKAFYKGFEKCAKDDANCYTAWREESASLIASLKAAATPATGQGMKWVKASERLPIKTGEYNGKYNNDRCLITIQGGKIVRISFSNGARLTDYFNDFIDTSKHIIEWLDESADQSPQPDKEPESQRDAEFDAACDRLGTTPTSAKTDKEIEELAERKEIELADATEQIKMLQELCIELSKRTVYTEEEKKRYWEFGCECGFAGLSLFVAGGGQIADTGDYGDCYCPCCGKIAD